MLRAHAKRIGDPHASIIAGRFRVAHKRNLPKKNTNSTLYLLTGACFEKNAEARTRALVSCSTFNERWRKNFGGNFYRSGVKGSRVEGVFIIAYKLFWKELTVYVVTCNLLKKSLFLFVYR